MWFLAGILMAVNAALFFFGAIQHAGVAIGPLSEPRIIPAAIVESLCGLSLVWGATAIFQHRTSALRTAVVSNLIALSGVVLGMAALAAGAGPRTASNDMYHRIMLLLIAAAVTPLLIRYVRSAPRRS